MLLCLLTSRDSKIGPRQSRSARYAERLCCGPNLRFCGGSASSARGPGVDRRDDLSGSYIRTLAVGVLCRVTVGLCDDKHIASWVNSELIIEGVPAHRGGRYECPGWRRDDFCHRRRRRGTLLQSAARNDIDGASPGRVRRLAHVCSSRKSHRCTPRMLLHGRGGPSDRERLGPLPPMPAPLFAPRETALSRMRTSVLHLEPRELRACEMLLRRVRTLCTEWCDFQ